MVIIFTSNTKGGIIQFAFQMAQTFGNIGYDCRVMLPDVWESSGYEQKKCQTILYRKVKTFSGSDTDFLQTVERLRAYEPELIVYADSSIMSMRVLLQSRMEQKSIVVMHDVYPHLTRESLKTRLVNLTADRLAGLACKRCLGVLLLSESCRRLYEKRYPKLKKKTAVMRLGAHVPVEGTVVPEGIQGVHDYFLFFGRIDRYKGIYRLLMAYQQYLESGAGHHRLVIAGAGTFSEEEEKLLVALPEVICLNRFLADEEITPLYQAARTIVLPYIEASQSGVLPIAYKYGKPVIVSDLPGLTENVWEQHSGLIAKDTDALVNALEQMDDETRYQEMCREVADYYRENYDWEQNLRRVLEQYGISQ